MIYPETTPHILLSFDNLRIIFILPIMKKILYFSGILFLLSITACSETYSVDSKMDIWQAERDLLDSISSSWTSTICFEYTPTGLNHQFFEGYRSSTDVIDTFFFNSQVPEFRIKVHFVDTNVCNYTNTQIMLNGEIIQGHKYPYDSTQIQYDSLLCGNIRETHVFIPSTVPNSPIHTEVGFEPRGNYDHYFAKGHFFSRVYPAYYMQQYKVWADTLNSKCFLKTPVDSIQLKMVFEEKAQTDYEYPSAMIAINDSAKLVEFLQGESVAILSCALVYQSGTIPVQVDHVNYYSEKIYFREVQKNRIVEAYWTKGKQLVLRTNQNKAVEKIWIKVANNGKTEYHFITGGSAGCYGNSCYRYLPADEIYSHPDSSTKNDSILVLAAFNQEALSSYKEYSFQNRMNSDFIINHRIQEYDTLALGELFESILDSIKSAPSDFYYFDAIKVEGYVDSLYNLPW